MSISTPPHGGLPAGGTSSVAPPIPGCETTLQRVYAFSFRLVSLNVDCASFCVLISTLALTWLVDCENNNADKHEFFFF